MIRVCKDRKRKYLSLSISLNPIHWNFEKNKPKRNCPNREQLEKLIADQTTVFSEQIMEFKATKKDFTATTFLKNIWKGIEYFD